MTAAQIVARLQAMANPANVAGMARYGISTAGTLGGPMPPLRALTSEIGKNHALARMIWGSGLHEARILASLIADHRLVPSREMDRWIRDVDSWDLCDQVCHNLWRYTPMAFTKAAQWSRARA